MSLKLICKQSLLVGLDSILNHLSIFYVFVYNAQFVAGLGAVNALTASCHSTRFPLNVLTVEMCRGSPFLVTQVNEFPSPKPTENI